MWPGSENYGSGVEMETKSIFCRHFKVRINKTQPAWRVRDRKIRQS